MKQDQSVKIYMDNQQELKGNIIIIHGMQEDSSRYVDVANYLTKAGYGVLTFDVLGHGPYAEKLGVIDHEDGFNAILNQVSSYIDKLKTEHPDARIIIMGHSMGSLIARAVLMRHQEDISQAILIGTPPPKTETPIGKALANMLINIKGDEAYSSMFKNLVFGKADKKFPDLTWLSKNQDNVKAYKENDNFGFRFTIGAYRDLFDLVIDLKNKEHHATNEQLPIKFYVGGEDPIVEGEKGLQRSIQALRKIGFKNISFMSYPELRHEILNEDCKYEILDNMIEYLNNYN